MKPKLKRTSTKPGSSDKSAASKQRAEGAASAMPTFQVNDRRFWQQEDAAAGQGQAGKERNPFPTVVQGLQEEIAAKEGEIDRMKEAVRLQREEQRKTIARLERNKEQELLNMKADLIAPLLEIGDNLVMTLESIRARNADNQILDDGTVEGIAMVLQDFERTLNKVGVVPFDVLGGHFDPQACEAMTTVETDDRENDNRVVEEYRRGYRLSDRVIRPARVAVAQYRSNNVVEDAENADRQRPDSDGVTSTPKS